MSIENPPIEVATETAPIMSIGVATEPAPVASSEVVTESAPAMSIEVATATAPAAPMAVVAEGDHTEAAAHAASLPTVVPTATIPAEMATISTGNTTVADAGAGQAPRGLAVMASTDNARPPALPNDLVCDIPTTTELAPGEVAELACAYTVNDPAATALVTASFANVPGDGWTVAINDGAAGETVTWVPAEPLARGTTVDFAVRVTAPADAGVGQQASVMVAGDGVDQVVGWPLAVDTPEVGGISLMAASGPCTQVSPAGTDAVAIGEDAVFRCGRASLSQSQVENIWFDFAATGWGYWVEGMPTGQYIAYDTNDTNTAFQQNPIAILFGSQRSFEVRLRPFQGVTPGSGGTLTITYTGRECHPFAGCSWGQLAESTVHATWATPTATCMLASPQEAIVRLSAYATFKCIFSNPPFQARITTTNDTRFQWAHSIGTDPVANPSGWKSYTGLTFPSSYTDNSIDTLYVYIRPNPFNPPEVGTEYSLDVELYQTINPSYWVTQPLAVSYTAVSCDPTVSLTSSADFSTSTWNGDSYTETNSRLAMAIAPIGSSCDVLTDGWSVSMQTDGLYRNGDPSSSDHIPPTAITFQGFSVYSPGGILPAPSTALNATGPTRIAGVGPLSMGSSYIFMRLQPPSDAPLGNYTGTITVTIASDD